MCHCALQPFAYYDINSLYVALLATKCKIMLKNTLYQFMSHLIEQVTISVHLTLDSLCSQKH